jgi:hypothetical protein
MRAALLFVGLAIAAVVAGAAILLVFWAAVAKVEFWRRGYRIRQLGPKGYWRMPLGPKPCVYEERGPDGKIRSLSFIRVIVGAGYPAPSELHFPGEEAWDALVFAEARGRRAEIVGRVQELLRHSARVVE